MLLEIGGCKLSAVNHQRFEVRQGRQGGPQLCYPLYGVISRVVNVDREDLQQIIYFEYCQSSWENRLDQDAFWLPTGVILWHSPVYMRIAFKPGPFEMAAKELCQTVRLLPLGKYSAFCM